MAPIPQAAPQPATMTDKPNLTIMTDNLPTTPPPAEGRETTKKQVTTPTKASIIEAVRLRERGDLNISKRQIFKDHGVSITTGFKILKDYKLFNSTRRLQNDPNRYDPRGRKRKNRLDDPEGEKDTAPTKRKPKAQHKKAAPEASNPADSKNQSAAAKSKKLARDKVWRALRKVALPDSRHHFTFSEFIADFQNSQLANKALFAHPVYTNARTVFITPDNCLEDLRWWSLCAGKTVLITTYAIRRGFFVLDPSLIAPEDYRYAATLDGMEKTGIAVTLSEIRARGMRVEVMVTGTGAINHRGVRFGKGHGFFDLEWGMLSSVGVADMGTRTAAVVHDCQVLEEELVPEEFDTVCDMIVTPGAGVRDVWPGEIAKKPICGIIWDKLQPDMMLNIPPLKELKTMEERGETVRLQ